VLLFVLPQTRPQLDTAGNENRGSNSRVASSDFVRKNKHRYVSGTLVFVVIFIRLHTHLRRTNFTYICLSLIHYIRVVTVCIIYLISDIFV
jgi:hypothetical protein